MTENINFFDQLDRNSTSFYSHHDITLEKNMKMIIIIIKLGKKCLLKKN